jgi:hypothetical protein
VVIDSEGSTFDILTSFSERRRIIVTPLKPSRVSELEVSSATGMEGDRRLSDRGR